MNYYILYYQVIVDGVPIDELVKVGVQSKNTEYMPNEIKGRIISTFRSKIPNKPIETLQVQKQQVTQQEYQNSFSTFQMFFRNL